MSKNPVLRGIFTFFRSAYLAVFLISYLILYLIIVSLIDGPIVPSGGESIPLLFLPLTLFSANLLTCTVTRILLTLRTGGYRGARGFMKLGPDLVHISLLILIAAALISMNGRIAGVVELSPGDVVRINREYSLELVDFLTQRYPDGRPKAWISSVNVVRGQELLRREEKIRVNDPLKVDRVNIYQMGYRELGDETATILSAVYEPAEPLILPALWLFLGGIFLILLDKFRKVNR